MVKPKKPIVFCDIDGTLVNYINFFAGFELPLNSDLVSALAEQVEAGNDVRIVSTDASPQRALKLEKDFAEVLIEKGFEPERIKKINDAIFKKGIQSKGEQVSLTYKKLSEGRPFVVVDDVGAGCVCYKDEDGEIKPKLDENGQRIPTEEARLFQRDLAKTAPNGLYMPPDGNLGEYVEFAVSNANRVSKPKPPMPPQFNG